MRRRRRRSELEDARGERGRENARERDGEKEGVMFVVRTAPAEGVAGLGGGRASGRRFARSIESVGSLVTVGSVGTVTSGSSAGSGVSGVSGVSGGNGESKVSGNEGCGAAREDAGKRRWRPSWR